MTSNMLRVSAEAFRRVAEQFPDRTYIDVQTLLGRLAQEYEAEANLLDAKSTPPIIGTMSSAGQASEIRYIYPTEPPSYVPLGHAPLRHVVSDLEKSREDPRLPEPDESDPFTEALVEAMKQPVSRTPESDTSYVVTSHNVEAVEPDESDKNFGEMLDEGLREVLAEREAARIAEPDPEWKAERFEPGAHFSSPEGVGSYDWSSAISEALTRAGYESTLETSAIIDHAIELYGAQIERALRHRIANRIKGQGVEAKDDLLAALVSWRDIIAIRVHEGSL